MIASLLSQHGELRQSGSNDSNDCLMQCLGRTKRAIDVQGPTQPRECHAVPFPYFKHRAVYAPLTPAIYCVVFKVLSDVPHCCEVGKGAIELLDCGLCRRCSGAVKGNLGGTPYAPECYDQELQVRPPPKHELVILGLRAANPSVL